MGGQSREWRPRKATNCSGSTRLVCLMVGNYQSGVRHLATTVNINVGFTASVFLCKEQAYLGHQSSLTDVIINKI
eukprot:scaffold98431_cov19-Prasinocladus_malaysianus.AAC.1